MLWLRSGDWDAWRQGCHTTFVDVPLMFWCQSMMVRRRVGTETMRIDRENMVTMVHSARWIVLCTTTCYLLPCAGHWLWEDTGTQGLVFSVPPCLRTSLTWAKSMEQAYKMKEVRLLFLHWIGGWMAWGVDIGLSWSMSLNVTDMSQRHVICPNSVTYLQMSRHL